VSAATSNPGTARTHMEAAFVYADRRDSSDRHSPGNPSVLLVDDDHCAVDLVTQAIHPLGIRVVSVVDGRQALAAANRTQFNLWLLETKLPDLHGLDVVRRLRAEGHKTPFIVISRCATVQGAVEAIKCGALGVLEKPVRLEELRNIVRTAVASTALDRLISADPRTPSERWCNFVIGLVASDRDLKTNALWANHVGVSLSALRDCCRRVNLKVEDSRNFARALRAISRSHEHWTPETVLDIDDARTLKRFEERSGVQRGMTARGRAVPVPTIKELFERQAWVPRDNPALLTVRRLLGDVDDRQTSFAHTG
jgi:DNA-binding response OmpR family regulator